MNLQLFAPIHLKGLFRPYLAAQVDPLCVQSHWPWAIGRGQSQNHPLRPPFSKGAGNKEKTSLTLLNRELPARTHREPSQWEPQHMGQYPLYPPYKIQGQEGVLGRKGKDRCNQCCVSPAAALRP